MAEQLQMHTKDLSQEKIRMLGELFPNCVTESRERERVVLSVDFDALRQELSDHVIEGPKERYQFTWPDKAKARVLANTPTTMTLRPCREESVDFDNTKNLYIEGDNLEVLKILRETYLGKVKMIYIDPPYNTGRDYLYNDDYSLSVDDYLPSSGDYDEVNNRLSLNSTTNGRFHTDWICKIYSRLTLARDLLSEDGAIFISIDDNEVFNLGKMCNEIFGENNFIAQMVIDGTPKNDPLIISTAHEYCLVYVKNYNIAKTKQWGVSNPIYKDILNIFKQGNGNYEDIRHNLKQYYNKNGLLDDNISNYKFADKNGVYRIGPIDDPQGSGPTDRRINPKTGLYCATPPSGWRCTIETWTEWMNNNLIEFPDDDSKLPSKKTYVSEGQLDVLRAYIKIQTRKDSEMIKKMFDGKKVFLFPKPVTFIQQLIDGCTSDGDIVLDFYSGSGTTAHALMKQCSEDNKKRSFILVQLPESLKDNLSRASGNRSKNSINDAVEFCNAHNLPLLLTEISKERIRRAGTIIKHNNPHTDCGFRVYKLDSSNMNDVFYSPDEIKHQSLDNYGDNIKSDRTPEDLLIQVMLELGIELSAPISEETIGGQQIFNVDDGYLIASLSDTTTEQMVTEIAKKESKPIFAVIRNGPGMTDEALANIEQIFKTYSPQTTVRML